MFLIRICSIELKFLSNIRFICAGITHKMDDFLGYFVDESFTLWIIDENIKISKWYEKDEAVSQNDSLKIQINNPFVYFIKNNKRIQFSKILSDKLYYFAVRVCDDSKIKIF